MNNNLIEVEARLLAKFCRNPESIFDVDGGFLDEADFSKQSFRCIYSALRDLATKSSKIEPVVLTERVASMFPEHYKSNVPLFRKMIKKLCHIKPASDLGEHVRIILTTAIKRRLGRHLAKLGREVIQLHDYSEVLSAVENQTMDFVLRQMKHSDVNNLGAALDEFLLSKEEMIKQGKTVGIASGFTCYDMSIGGGFRRGCVDVVVARAKTGKSLLAMNIGYNVAMQQIPVLYLDTELLKSQEMSRMLSMATNIPLWYLDHGKFLLKEAMTRRLKERGDSIRKLSLDHIEIGGWKLQRQLSQIRSWCISKVGRGDDGKINPCLIIVDYLKIMDPSDKGYDTKEHEALGYQMDAYHRLARDMEIPLFVLCQQNRLGLEESHEGTVAGSDRISWFCDSLGLLAKRRWQDLQAAYEGEEGVGDKQPYNMELKVLLSRFGPGHYGNERVVLYSDFCNPKLPFKKRAVKIKEYGIEKMMPHYKQHRRAE